MNKPSQIRTVLTNAVLHLKQNPDTLHVFIENGNLFATGVNENLSFEYQYDCVVTVTDFAAHPDLLMVPLLAWAIEHQPELLHNPDKRAGGITFKAELVSHSSCDIEIKLKLTERVKVESTGNGMTATHLPEPKIDTGITWQLYINQELVEWPPTSISLYQD